jgi:cell division protease FtsH
MIISVRLPHRHPSGSAKPGPPRDPAKPAPAPPPRWRAWLPGIGIALTIALLLWSYLLGGGQPPAVPYSDFVAKVDAGQVKAVTIDDKGAVTGTLTNGHTFASQIPTALGNSQLDQQLRTHHVQVTATPPSGSWLLGLLSFLPLLIMIAIFMWSGRLAQRSLAGGIGGFGRSKARVIEAQRPKTRFADIAGYDGVKQEVSEVVDFLRDPSRYAAAGATGPRGVIMIGPPGTGKTLIARAVAGEAEVPFLSVTGSEFVEMFVGVGASRVRDLFDDARKRAPSIIFIDEIDAIGCRRAGPVAGAHEEREQTLNQLLAEMDGFDQSSGIVVLAATNRPDALDRALLRPGRFDRQVTVPLPNQAERAAILAVHAHGKHLEPDADLGIVARGTPGFSGADLANLVNEAAINAVRDDRTIITAHDLDAARDRVLLGRRETSNALLPEERHAVAVHESGHALLAALCAHADPVAKVTILPAGPTLGTTPRGRTPPLQRGLPGRPARGPPRRARRGTGRLRRRLHRCRQRPRWRHPDRHPDGVRVRALPRARPGRLPHRRPRRPRGTRPGRTGGAGATAVLRTDPTRHRRRGDPAAAPGRTARGRPPAHPPHRPRPARRAPGRAGDRRRRGRAESARR